MQPEVPSREAVFGDILAVQSLRDRALLASLYLTAGRINEITPRLYRRVTIPVAAGEGGRPAKMRVYERVPTMGLRPADISFVEHGGHELMIITLMNEKNRMHPTKQLPVLLGPDRPLAAVLVEWMGIVSDASAPMFPFSSVTGWKICKRSLGIHPHWLRHTRLTHLRDPPYSFDHIKLMKFAGWSDTKPADRYIHTTWRDFF